MKTTRRTCSVLIALVLSLIVGGLCATPAQAAVPSFVTVKAGCWANTAKLGAKEKKAYQRAYKAALAYESKANPIVVDVSDLGLTTAQARHVQYLLHSNGELFFIDTYKDANYTKKTLKLQCLYDDATITSMRTKVDAAITKAMKRITPQMDAATKILTLHDYLIDLINYEEHQKTAYTGLVQHEADCMGYAQTMDLVLRRAGFTTDMAYSFSGEHVWNLVKVAGKWYHIDLTWDAGYSYTYYWKKKHCHLYLLQPDKRMKSDGYTDDGHGRWWAHYRSTSTTYYQAAESGTTFADNKWKLYVKGFSLGGFKYKLYGSNKVMLVGVTSTKYKKAAGIVVPKTITRKGVTYKVVALGDSAFKGTKAKTLGICTPYLTKARTKGCLTGSKIKTVKVKTGALGKRNTYKKVFTQENTGSTYTLKVV